MRHCYLSFTRNPADLSLLNELHCHVHGLSERARGAGYVALHRLSQAFSEFTRGLYEAPDLINRSAARTIDQTIEFLGQLIKEGHVDALQNPASARIYIVDDDADNALAIRMALQEQMMQATCAHEPSLALQELAVVPFDLIILDVLMPEMDGFELCRQIRALPAHATTPVIFLTGLASAEARVQAGQSGADDFVGKPFSLDELSVKVLTLLLKSSRSSG